MEVQQKKWYGTWPYDCDLCDGDLTKEEFFIDGRISRGTHGARWGLMCPRCHIGAGVGLGTGRGQKYCTKTLNKLEG